MSCDILVFGWTESTLVNLMIVFEEESFIDGVKNHNCFSCETGTKLYMKSYV